jgi:hypothetical protein
VSGFTASGRARAWLCGSNGPGVPARRVEQSRLGPVRLIEIRGWATMSRIRVKESDSRVSRYSRLSRQFGSRSLSGNVWSDGHLRRNFLGAVGLSPPTAEPLLGLSGESSQDREVATNDKENGQLQADFVNTVRAEYVRLSRHAVRQVRTWRSLRLLVLVLAAPIAPVALTSHGWIAAVLGASVVVVEGALALWNIQDVARAELEMANRLEIELIRYQNRLPPYDLGQPRRRDKELARRFAELDGVLAERYLRIFDSIVEAGARQAASRGAGPQADGRPVEPPANESTAFEPGIL